MAPARLALVQECAQPFLSFVGDAQAGDEGGVVVVQAKSLVRRVAFERDRDRLDHDNAALIARLRVSDEGQEGLGAFLDKRKPRWCE